MNAQAVPAVTLDAVVAAAKALVPVAEQTLLGDFTRAFYARQPEEDLSLRPVASWATIAATMFAFAATRNAGEARVRVVTPGRDADGGEGNYTLIQVANDDMPFLVDSVGMVLSQR